MAYSFLYFWGLVIGLFPSVRFPDLFDLRGFSHTPELLKLTINFQPAAHFDGFQLAERDVTPLCVLEITVQDRKAPKQVISCYDAGDKKHLH